MRALGNKAADEGNGLKRLANAARITRAESLSRSILSDKPNTETVEKLAQALFPRDAGLIARALLAKLPRRECRAALQKILDREGKRVFGEAVRENMIHEGGRPPRLESRRSNWDPILVSNSVIYWLEEDGPPGALEKAARAAILAKYGLEDALEGGRANDPLLGRVLGALERVLKKHKLGSLRSFLRDQQHERDIMREASDLFHRLLYILPFSEDEEQELKRIIDPHLAVMKEKAKGNTR